MGGACDGAPDTHSGECRGCQHGARQAQRNGHPEAHLHRTHPALVKPPFTSVRAYFDSHATTAACCLPQLRFCFAHSCTGAYLYGLKTCSMRSKATRVPSDHHITVFPCLNYISSSTWVNITHPSASLSSEAFATTQCYILLHRA